MLGGLLSATLVSVTACGGNVVANASGSTSSGSGGAGTSSSTGVGAGTTSSTGTGGAAGCVTSGSSSLPGVTIDFPAQRCSFTLAEASAGITFHYDVIVAMDGISVVPQPEDAGGCDSAGPSGLIPLSTVSGGGQSYCLCDVGFCAPPSMTPVTLAMGTYPDSFTWDGKNWGGPSDTGNPKGPAFPPGHYTLTVSAKGQVEMPGPAAPFVVTGTLDIEITP
jgi:hypothetical protein